ncbi:uncharacterized protein M6B38_118195 [Iris pallida]|uniref:Phosphorylated adapter RNA export protein n=1 Tax=Iris pallida TaxID=29817 RepID=A0AAX6HJA3_IRIPA|nr:uncharacterized protein M6B38_118195 [Iris pallida]
MEGTEASLLDPIFDETLDCDDDVDMLDADEDAGLSIGSGDSSAAAAEGGDQKKRRRRRKKKKKSSSSSRKRKGGDFNAPNITDINRFVIDTCRRLREKKSYLVWNAVGCLGVSAFSDIVKEVDVIQGCGGQKTTDGKRYRTGGGILWNILKTREPKAYNEIMAKGKEFEKQLWRPKKKQMTNKNGAKGPQSVPDEAKGGEVLHSSEHVAEMQQGLEPSGSSKGHLSVQDRIRLPVSYEDLYEEGEIHE